MRACPGRAAAAVLAGLLMLAPVATPAGAETITVDGTPIGRFHVRDPIRRFGPLTFLGGLAMTSRSRAFGGLSGLVASDDGRDLLIVSDDGDWIALRLDQAEDGTPRGVAAARVDRRLSVGGAPVASKTAGDAEALTRDGDGYLVSVETERQLLFYPGPDPTVAEPQPRALPKEAGCVPGNGGIEAIAVAPPSSPVAGTLVMFAERGCTSGPVAMGAGALPVWLAGPSGTRRMTLVKDGDFRPTDAAFLPGGDLLLLERRYNGGFDIGMRIRRIGRDAFAGRAPLDGPVLMEADFAYEIDNMEGLAVSRDAHGRPLVTLISDDNKSFLQRNLLLRFRLDQPVPAVRPRADAPGQPR